MKRKWMGLVGMIVLVTAGVMYLVFINPPGDISIEGRWQLAAGPEECYAGAHFMRGVTPQKGGASLKEVRGNYTQMSYGTYEKKKNRLTVSLNNPPAPPFDLQMKEQGERLELNYARAGKQLGCVYTPEKK